MAPFNLDCPKGYGQVTFIERPRDKAAGVEVVCPISSTKDCVDCDVIKRSARAEDRQVKREGGEEE